MDPLDDLPIEKGHEPTDGPDASASRTDSRRVVVVSAVMVAAVALVVWYIWLREPEAARPVAGPQDAVQSAAQVREPLGPPVDAIDLPPLFLTDPLVRDLVGRLSSRPEVMAWLATEGLIRTLVVCIENVASGQSPARHLTRLAPKAPFRVVRRGAGLVIDPASYGRYNGIADAVASLDPAGLARVYSLLKPRLVDAYRELGHPEGDIDGATERAIGVLLRTPVIDAEIDVTEKVVSYTFLNEELESLQPAQKQLMRMGLRNQALITDQLRAIGMKLGIPASRLPGPVRIMFPAK